MINNKVTIHQFSDKIKYEYINGELISRGFEFGFMNSTLNPIPLEIQYAIRNTSFKVKCSKSNSQQPALVARVIENWSVIAVVSQIRDDGGRFLEVSRYFVAEGGDSLWKIIDYLEQFKNKTGQYPVFNPPQSEKMTKAPDYILNTDKTPVFPPFSPDVYGYLQTHNNLIELNELNKNGYTLQHINSLASSVANNSSYAWAYNVSSLEKPHNFDLIIASDSSAFSDILLVLNAPKIEPVRVSYSFDESAVKSAMKELISNSFPSRHLTTMNDAIQNSSITDENWHQIFNTERADRAVKEQIKGERIARLLTLRALILPETLVDLLKWLEIDGNEKCWDDYLQFSKKFYNSSELVEGAKLIINDNIKNGVYGLLFHVLKGDIKPKTVADLLTQEKSIFRSVKIYLIKDIEKDIKLIGDGVAILDDDSLIFRLKVWEKLAKDRKEDHSLPWMGSNTKKRVYTIPFYKPFVELFDYLDELRLYSYFAQVSLGEVPISKKDFHESFQRNSEATLHKLKLFRQISSSEKLVNVLISGGVPVWSLFLVAIIFLGLGEFVKPLSALGKICLPLLCDRDVKNFENKTVASLGQLVQHEYTEDEIKQVICSEDKTCPNDLEWGNSISNITDEQKKTWSEKIKDYQSSAIKNEKGYIGEKTKNKIIADIKNIRKPESTTIVKPSQGEITPSTPKPANQTSAYVADALSAFDARTKVAINALINDPDVEKQFTNEKPKIVDKLKEILGNNDLNNEVILGNNDLNNEVILGNNEKDDDIKKWIVAIYEYQTKNSLSTDGIIDNPGGTFTKLREELLK